MNAAPTPIYTYAYTAWAGRDEKLEKFIGEIEAGNHTHARSRIRALHRAMGYRVPRIIKLAAGHYERLSNEAPLRIRFHRNSRPIGNCISR